MIDMQWQCVHGDNEWCSAGDPCFDCATSEHDAMHPEPRDGCMTCKLRSLVVGANVGMETRGRKFAPLGVDKSHNAWERGLATDERGMPLLTMSGRQITTKEYGERRSVIDAARHRVRNDPHAFDSTTTK